MSHPVIEVSNISKQYRLGKVGSGTLAHDLQRWWAKVRGKEDPFLRLSETNQRDQKGSSEYVWALKDVNFSVNQGDVLGIIGRNGAGKSTLLKILSQVTEPTTGELKIKGRVASLLEVGTGFHPDLTGRENIFLNGAILGMTRAEIKSKFDEILNFSGVERYIDTPVKRYSSGMKVRLGFAVAAHLEPEILIVDEVLAVGDAEFQRKCLGKMRNVAGQGRTVLFVSHNLFAIRSLCTRAILIEHGTVVRDGGTDEVANEYVSQNRLQDADKRMHTWAEGSVYSDVRLIRASIQTADEVLSKRSSLQLEIEVELREQGDVLPVVVFHLVNEDDLVVFGSSAVEENPENSLRLGRTKMQCTIPGDLLNTGTYRIKFLIAKGGRMIYKEEDVLSFTVNELSGSLTASNFNRKAGVVRPSLKWKIERYS